MPYPSKRVPVNLTAMTEALGLPGPRPEMCRAGEARGCTLEVCGLDHAGDEHPGEAPADTVYVIASGYGLLRCGDTELECTAGDVLFVPGGQAHRFEQLGGEIRIWRISAVPGPAPDGTPD